MNLTDGKIKQNDRQNYAHPLRVTLEQPDGRPSSTFLMANPLIEVLEYPDEDGNLTLKTVRHDTARFHLRFNWSRGDDQLRITSLPNDPDKLNFLIKLSP